jgi:hypothetical protein
LGNWVFRQKPQLPNYPINCFENPIEEVFRLIQFEGFLGFIHS